MESQFYDTHLRRRIPIPAKSKVEFVTLNGQVMCPKEDYTMSKTRVHFTKSWRRKEKRAETVGIFYTPL